MTFKPAAWNGQRIPLHVVVQHVAPLAKMRLVAL
jgi:hypothetical protein